MLYDPKWDQQTKADPLTLESLIAWLEMQPANRAYDYRCNGHCMLAQYFTAQGFEDISVGGVTFEHRHQNTVRIPFDFGEIAYGGLHPYGKHISEARTFGAALNRARAALAAS